MTGYRTESALSTSTEDLLSEHLQIKEHHSSRKVTLTHPYTILRGDNLDWLCAMAHQEKTQFDLCYIDPPYNTGSKFAYADQRRASTPSLFGSNSAWMQFMLPRLQAGRHCLNSLGLMLVSIDDYAYAHLKIMMDAVFGEEHYLGTITVCRSKNGKSGKIGIATGHEYVLIYRKTGAGQLYGTPDEQNYPKEDVFGKYRIDGLFRKKGDASLRGDRPNLYYPVYANPFTGEVSATPKPDFNEIYPLDSKGIERRWVWSIETLQTRIHELYCGPSGTIYVKNYQKMHGRKKVSSMWDDPAYYSERGTVEMKSIFGEKVFDTPKPIAFIKRLLSISAGKNAKILDFFAGSGTTAVAAHQLNLEDNGSRQVTLIESVTSLPAKSPGTQLGFFTIADITHARLVNSGISNIDVQGDTAS